MNPTIALLWAVVLLMVPYRFRATGLDRDEPIEFAAVHLSDRLRAELQENGYTRTQEPAASVQTMEPEPSPTVEAAGIRAMPVLIDISKPAKKQRRGFLWFGRTNADVETITETVEPDEALAQAAADVHTTLDETPVEQQAPRTQEPVVAAAAVDTIPAPIVAAEAVSVATDVTEDEEDDDDPLGLHKQRRQLDAAFLKSIAEDEAAADARRIKDEEDAERQRRLEEASQWLKDIIGNCEPGPIAVEKRRAVLLMYANTDRHRYRDVFERVAAEDPELAELALKELAS